MMKVLLKQVPAGNECYKVEEVLIFHNDKEAEKFLKNQKNLFINRENEIKFFKESIENLFHMDKMALDYYKYQLKKNPMSLSKDALKMMVEIEKKMEAIEVIRPKKINYVWKIENPKIMD